MKEAYLLMACRQQWAIPTLDHTHVGNEVPVVAAIDGGAIGVR